MKFLSFILSLSLCFWLVSCDKNSHTQHSADAMPMQQLGILLDQAIGIMGQGAVLKQEGKKASADAMLAQSAGLLRRAMSGPEMAAMHKGGQGESAMMQHTHALGAAAFDLLDLMMSSSAQNISQDDETLHHALTMAAQGASMKVSAASMNQDIGGVMQAHALQMQTSAIKLSHQAVAVPSAYQKAVLKVIGLLTEHGESNMKGMH